MTISPFSVGVKFRPPNLDGEASWQGATCETSDRLIEAVESLTGGALPACFPIEIGWSEFDSDGEGRNGQSSTTPSDSNSDLVRIWSEFGQTSTKQTLPIIVTEQIREFSTQRGIVWDVWCMVLYGCIAIQRCMGLYGCMAPGGRRDNACPLYGAKYSKLKSGPRRQFGPRRVPDINSCSLGVLWVL